MGIGGAAVYGLALVVLRALERIGAQIARLLGWAWRLFVDSAAIHGAQLYASPAASRRPWNEVEERKGPPRH